MGRKWLRLNGPAENFSCPEGGVDFGGRQIIGTRAEQEDCYGVIPPAEFCGERHDLLAIVADGMGGHVGGKIASTTAVDIFAKQFLISSYDSDPARLWDALETANRQVSVSIAESDGQLDGMGTTLVGVLLRGLSLRWISVGDSPLYLFRDGELQQLNETHTNAVTLDQQAREGIISEEEALSNSERKFLNSALIGEELYHVDDSGLFDLLAEDVLIAATDGIQSLSDEQIGETVQVCRGRDSSAIAEGILNRVRSEDHPRQDNTSVVVITTPGKIPDIQSLEPA